MKVRELIAHLETLDPELPVWAYDASEDFSPLSVGGIREETDAVWVELPDGRHDKLPTHRIEMIGGWDD